MPSAVREGKETQTHRTIERERERERERETKRQEEEIETQKRPPYHVAR
jgi:hypothetical protein